jgi:TolB-like protein
MTIARDGAGLLLPASRKVRALLAYLALSPRPVPRSRLCELLWDVPNDPRGELRWCLTKLRRILDGPGRPRVESSADMVGLDLTDCFVDVNEIVRATEAGIGELDADRLRALLLLFVGEFLDGLEIDRSPHFNAWLAAERRRFRSCHIAVLEHLVGTATGEEIFGYLEKWLQLAPFDRHVHVTLLGALAQRDRIREGEEHLAATARLFEAEGLEHAPLRDAWRTARAEAARTAPAAMADPAPPASARSGDSENVLAASRRASIAVMPFVDRTGHPGGYADGLVHDIITRLAKLRSLFVIAQGTVFALHERAVSAEQAGRTLNVDYVVTGSAQRQDRRLIVSVELAETRTARIAWAEVFDHKLDDAFLVLDEIGNRIVASIATEVEAIERNRAILRPPNSLDAWSAHHRGLWHMYRFDKENNEKARNFFEMAVRLDPTFSRAYAGLSFTHFQNAFQNWAKRDLETDLAFEAAGQSLMADDRDPAAHWAMGRALWLRGQQDQSLVELERAVELSPNFAIGHYTLAFVRSQAGDARAAIESSDHSRHLSPFDPLLFAMLGARAMALVRLGEFEEAADWARKGAARPNAHAHIMAIAAYSLALANRIDEARSHVAAIRKTRPNYSVDDFIQAFRFEPHAEALFRQAAERIR